MRPMIVFSLLETMDARHLSTATDHPEPKSEASENVRKQPRMTNPPRRPASTFSRFKIIYVAVR